MLLEAVLIALVATLFLALLSVAVLRHVRRRQPGAAELAVALGMYALVALAAVMLEAGPTWVRVAAEAFLSAGLAVVPYLMVRFAAAFRPLTGRQDRWLRGGTVALVLAAAPVGVEGLLPGPIEIAVLSIFVAAWVVAHGFAAYRLWSAGRALASAVVRRRAALMSAGVVGLATVMVVGAATGALTGDDVVPTLIWALAATFLFILGFVPPAWLRWQWSRRDRRSLTSAELQLLRTDDQVTIAEQLLPHVGRLLGARATWITDGATILASDGQVPVGVAQPTPLAGGQAAVSSSRQLGTDTWLVQVWTGRVWFCAVVGPYALLFGAEELEDVQLLAVQIDVALDRARLRAQELETVRRLEHARRLEQVDAIREDVLATVSHELRTPLTTVYGATEMLTARWDQLTDDQRRTFTERIHANATDLHRVVQGLIDLAVLRDPEDGSVLPVARWFPLDGLVATSLRGLKVALARHTVAVDVAPGIELETDPDALSRVLEHLLINAAKFSPVGSRIGVHGHVVGNEIRIRVTDEGPGLPPGDLARLLEPFTRGGHVLTRETRGLGVGLAVVAGLVDRMRGTLTVDTGTAQGTAFEVRLPRAATDPAVAPGEALARARA